jgi:hypothetical protein
VEAHGCCVRAPGALTTTQLDALTQASIPDVLDRLGLTDVHRGGALFRWFSRRAARRIARQLASYDQLVGTHGLLAGMEWLLQRFVGVLKIAGQAFLPRHGPLLLVANHPGLMDVPALLVGLGRSDVAIVAADRPFFRALPHTSRHVIYVSSTKREHARALRTAASHLRGGQAVLLFPAGRIEPDPEILPGAVESLQHWSPSIGHLVRLAPETQIVPAIVRGVLSESAWHHPLPCLRRQPEDRVRLAELLQILLPCFQNVAVQVTFARPLQAADLLADCQTPVGIAQAIVAEAAALMGSPHGVSPRVMPPCAPAVFSDQ